MSTKPAEYDFHDISSASLALDLIKRQAELSSQLGVVTNQLCLHYSAAVALRKELLASDKPLLREIGSLLGIPVDTVEQALNTRTNFHHTLDVAEQIRRLVQAIDDQLCDTTSADKVH